MPIHLTEISRRQFLQGVGVSLLACRTVGFAEESKRVDGDVVYLLNDTHIGAKHPEKSPVPTHLRQAVTELIERERKPAFVLINGDLALKNGQPDDYRHLAKLIEPLREADISTHLTMGNHDHRETFYDVLKERRPAAPVVASKHISVVETARANFFLLDSLQKTMVTQGTLGEEQLAWLAAALDAAREKPAIVAAHHNPRLGGDPNHFPGGLIDSQPLWDVLAPRPWVKAYIHGHVHDRTYAEHQGIHIINTPATSYVANPKKTATGWTVARLTDRGVTLTTHTTDPEHPWNGETKTLTWRSA